MEQTNFVIETILREWNDWHRLCPPIDMRKEVLMLKTWNPQTKTQQSLAKTALHVPLPSSTASARTSSSTMFARMNEWHSECGQADKSETSKVRLKNSDQQFIVNPGEGKPKRGVVCVLCVLVVVWCVLVCVGVWLFFVVFVVVLLFCRWLCGVVACLLLYICC